MTFPKHTLKTSTLLCSLVVGGVASAQEFSDSNLSPLRVSPAQNHQDAPLVLDTEAGFGAVGNSTKGKVGTDASDTDQNESFFVVGGSYALAPIPMQLGLHVTKGSYDQERTAVNGATAKTKSEYQEDFYTITPRVSYDLSPEVAVGYSAAFFNQESKLDGTSDDDSHVSQRMGVRYHQEAFEVGIAYQPQVGSKNRADKYQEAAALALHGRYRVSPTVNVGAVLQQFQESALDADAADAYATSLLLEVKPLAKLEVDGMYTYKADNSKKDQGLSAATAPSHDLYVAADYALQEAVKVGAFVNYLRQEDEDASSKIDTQGSKVGLRASYSF